MLLIHKLLRFRERVGDRPVTVTVTPNGYADAPNAGYFVMPHERVMPFAKFLDVIRNPDSEHGVSLVLIIEVLYAGEVMRQMCCDSKRRCWEIKSVGLVLELGQKWHHVNSVHVVLALCFFVKLFNLVPIVAVSSVNRIILNTS